MAETIIQRAPEDVLQIAADLIDEHHEHLQKARILWLVTSAKRSSKNRVVIGTSARTTALLRYLTARAAHDGQHASAALEPADFIVQIDEKRWKTMLATQKAACIDSCLCRMQWRETVNERSGNVTGRWITVGPDIEEFSEVLERHGAWLPEQARLVKIIRDGKQLRLDEADLARGIRGTDADEDNAANDAEAERITRVAPDGIVESTEVVSEARNGIADSDDQKDLADTENAKASAFHGSSVDSGETLLQQAAQDGEVADELSEIPGWEQRTGLGSSDLAQHRRRRGTVSSEQVAATP